MLLKETREADVFSLIEFYLSFIVSFLQGKEDVIKLVCHCFFVVGFFFLLKKTKKELETFKYHETPYC